MRFFLFFLMALLSFVACSPKNNKKVVVEVAPPAAIPAVVETPASRPATKGTPRERYVVAKIKKTPCYGQCPVYEAEFWSDGKATFNGIMNVKNMGKYEATFDPKVAQELSDRADRIGYFSMNGEYPATGEKIADLPYTITEVRRGDMIKHIENNYDSPVELQEFEEYLAKLTAEMAWRAAN